MQVGHVLPGAPPCPCHAVLANVSGEFVAQPPQAWLFPYRTQVFGLEPIPVSGEEQPMDFLGLRRPVHDQQRAGESLLLAGEALCWRASDAVQGMKFPR